MILIAAGLLFANYQLDIYDPDTDYYVANNGSNLNDGLNIDTPWATVSKVNSEFGHAIKTGDNIYFRCGDSFTDTSLRIRTGGTSTNPLIISSYGTGDKPNFNKLIYCDTSNIGHIIIENLDLGPIDNRNSLLLDGAGVKNITIRNMDIHDGDCGIQLRCINTYLVEDCYIHDCIDNAYTIYGSSKGEITNGLIQNCTATRCGEGFSIHKGDDGSNIGPHHTILNCKAIDLHGEDSYDLTAGDDIQMINCQSQNSPRGIAIGHNITNVLIDGYEGDSATQFGIYIGHSNGVILRNSIITNSGKETIRIYEDRGLNIEDVEIYNNIFADKSTSTRPMLRIRYSGEEIENDIYVHDNVFFSYRTGNLVSYIDGSTPDNTNSRYSNNVWWQISGTSSSFGFVYGVGSISFDWWKDKYPTETFTEPEYCLEPFGLNGDQKCGDSDYGQNPTRLYECRCDGTCSWVDIGDCNTPECSPDGT